MVVALVGILAMIAIPNLSSPRDSAHDTSLKNDARTFLHAVEEAKVETGEYPATRPTVQLSPDTIVVGYFAGTYVNFRLRNTKTMHEIAVWDGKMQPIDKP